MPLPLIPLAIAAVGGIIAGRSLSGTNNDAQVIVNPSNETGANVTFGQAALLAGVAVAAITIGPRVLESLK